MGEMKQAIFRTNLPDRQSLITSLTSILGSDGSCAERLSSIDHESRQWYFDHLPVQGKRAGLP
jgi:hypothetical protein